MDNDFINSEEFKKIFHFILQFQIELFRGKVDGLNLKNPLTGYLKTNIQKVLPLLPTIKEAILFLV